MTKLSLFNQETQTKMFIIPKFAGSWHHQKANKAVDELQITPQVLYNCALMSELYL